MRGRLLCYVYNIQIMVHLNYPYPFKSNEKFMHLCVSRREVFSLRGHLMNEMGQSGAISTMWILRSFWILILISACREKQKNRRQDIVHTTDTHLTSSNLNHMALPMYKKSRKRCFSLCMQWLSHRESSVAKESINI